MTVHVVVLALMASAFTATASVAQRSAAASAPEKSSFNIQLIGYLLPVWFVGIASVILGFALPDPGPSRGHAFGGCAWLEGVLGRPGSA